MPGAPGARYLRPLLASLARQGVDGGHLGRARRGGVQQPHLDLPGPGARAEGPARGHGHGHVPGAHPHHVVVLRRGQAQRQTVLQHHAHTPPAHRLVPGHHHVQAHGTALTQQELHALHQGAPVHGLEAGHVGVPPVNEQQEVGQALLRTGGQALLGHGRQAVQGQELLAPGDLTPQEVQEPPEPLRLVPCHHGAHVRQPGARQEGARPGVDPVDVHLLRGRGTGHLRGDPPQQGRAPRAGGPGHPQVPRTRVVPGHDLLGLFTRAVLQAQDYRGQQPAGTWVHRPCGACALCPPRAPSPGSSCPPPGPAWAARSGRRSRGAEGSRDPPVRDGTGSAGGRRRRRAAGVAVMVASLGSGVGLLRVLALSTRMPVGPKRIG